MANIQAIEKAVMNASNQKHDEALIIAYNKIARWDSNEFIEIPTNIARHAKPPVGWKELRVVPLVRIFRSNDGTKLGFIIDGEEDQSGLYIFLISPRISDDEVSLLYEALDSFETRIIDRKKIQDGVELVTEERTHNEMFKYRKITKKIPFRVYSVNIKFLDIVGSFNTQYEATNYAKMFVEKVRKAANRVVQQKFLDFKSEAEFKKLWYRTDLDLIDYIPARVYYTDGWRYFEGSWRGPTDMIPSKRHEEYEWVNFWSPLVKNKIPL